MEQAVEQVRWQDTIGSVTPGTIPWEITTPEGKPINWSAAISLPGSEPSIWVFVTADDVDYAVRESDGLLSEEDAQWLRDVLNRKAVVSEGDDEEPSQDERERLLSDFLALAAERNLVPDSDEAFDAAVEAGLLHSLALYDAAGSLRPVGTYVSNIGTAFPGFRPATLTTDGVTTLWSWPNGKTPPDLSKIDSSKYFTVTFKVKMYRIPVPFEIQSAATS